MSLYQRWKQFDEAMSESERLEHVKMVVDSMLPIVLALLLGALYFEFFVALPHRYEIYLYRVEAAILFYFAVELLVDLLIYRDNTAFFKDKWIDIVLLVPFFSVFRTAGRAFRALKVFKPLKTFKGLKPVKAGKAGKAGKAAKTGKLSKVGKGVRKIGKVVRHGKKAVHHFLRE